MPVKFDFHIHTRYSDGKCTHAEIAEAAQAKGLEAIAYTDHGPQLSVGISATKLEPMLRDIMAAREDADIHVFAGIEANVVDSSGEVDVPPDFVRKLDFLTVGIHNMDISDGQDKAHEYLNRAGEAIKKQNIDVLAHPFYFDNDLLAGLVPQEIEDFVDLAASRGVAMEVSAKYQVPNDDFIKLCLRKGVKLSVGSDAHRINEVGRIGWALAALERAGARRDDLIFDRLVR